MPVKTHRMIPTREDGPQVCQFCGERGNYWSQNELRDHRAAGAVVYHCQACREAARSWAGSNAAVQKKAKNEELMLRAGGPLADLFRKMVGENDRRARRKSRSKA